MRYSSGCANLAVPALPSNFSAPPHIAIVGAGGLAHAFLLALSSRARNAVHISILDSDIVELSNLNRQVLFAMDDIGLPKAQALANRFCAWIATRGSSERFPFVNAFPSRLDRTNINLILSGVAIVVDATDSVQTKFLLNDYCLKQAIPLCYAGVSGQNALALLIRQDSACLRCIFGDLTDGEIAAQSATCQQMGVFGPLVGLTGAVQAELVCQELESPYPKELVSKLIRISQEPVRFTATDITPNANCKLHQTPQRTLNLTGERCPMTFLYTKLALEQLSNDEVLEVTLSSAESAENVRDSVIKEGHSASLETRPPRWILKIRCNTSDPGT